MKNPKIIKVRLRFKLTFFSFLLGILFSCNNTHVNIGEKEVVEKPEDINARAEEVIQQTLKDILHNSNDLSDTFKIKNAAILQGLYDKNSFQPMWSSKGAFSKETDSLLSLIDTSKQYGLFPDDYYFKKLSSLQLQLSGDTSSKEKKLDAALWAYSDLLLSSAFVQLVKDIKVGRLLPDSVVAKDTTLSAEFFSKELNLFKQLTTDSFARQLEPANRDYQKLRTALQEFLPKANFRNYTLVSTKDSTQIPKLLYRRLAEEDSTVNTVTNPDSTQLASAIKKYQKHKAIKVDGKVSASLISKLNNTDKEKFIRIAINLDRYKQLPILPSQYIWVNIPSYYLQLRNSDTVALKSRVVVGKPLTRTPLITSAISDMMTYPKWTIPESIVKKEILPGLQRDPGYTNRKGFSLVDEKGNEINPYTVNWGKFKNSIPYKVVQGSGDANALGVLKFNFPNKFSVYLHDTNQRYLFSKTSRALSHGCVRVQDWEGLAKYILRNDSTYSATATPVDSLESWLAAKQKRYIPVRKPIPLYIRYFTCDVGSEGHLIFYEDIYGEDKRIRERIFTNK
jgi:murein L,D-transpeptidase YcbB/YkuD